MSSILSQGDELLPHRFQAIADLSWAVDFRHIEFFDRAGRQSFMADD